MRERVGFLVAGGLLVALGYAIATFDALPAAEAQSTVLSNQVRFFRAGDAVITASDDGRTLHFWSTNERDTDLQVRPRYVTTCR